MGLDISGENKYEVNKEDDETSQDLRSPGSFIWTMKQAAFSFID